MASARSGLEGHAFVTRTVPEFVEWILGALIVLAGMVAVVGGTALAVLVDRETLAAEIEHEPATVTVFTTELSEAEMIDLAHVTITWTGIGLLVTGAAMVLFGAGYVWHRHRAHRRHRAGEAVSWYVSYAVLGAITTALLSFVPFSPVLGGALSGYLERAESTRTVSIGAWAGLLPIVPLLVLIVFVLGGLVAGLFGVDEGGGGVVIAASMVLSILLLATFAAGLGAFGGYLGGWFAEYQVRSREPRE